VSEALIAEALHPYPENLVIATKGWLVSSVEPLISRRSLLARPASRSTRRPR
jgi:hypothetical protein